MVLLYSAVNNFDLTRKIVEVILPYLNVDSLRENSNIFASLAT